jgi:hypothetical protein
MWQDYDLQNEEDLVKFKTLFENNPIAKAAWAEICASDPVKGTRQEISGDSTLTERCVIVSRKDDVKCKFYARRDDVVYVFHKLTIAVTDPDYKPINTSDFFIKGERPCKAYFILEDPDCISAWKFDLIKKYVPVNWMGELLFSFVDTFL